MCPLRRANGAEQRSKRNASPISVPVSVNHNHQQPEASHSSHIVLISHVDVVVAFLWFLSAIHHYPTRLSSKELHSLRDTRFCGSSGRQDENDIESTKTTPIRNRGLPIRNFISFRSELGGRAKSGITEENGKHVRFGIENHRRRSWRIVCTVYWSHSSNMRRMWACSIRHSSFR